MDYKKWLPVGAYLGFGLFILGPLLLPGFVLALDMVFVPHMPMLPELRPSWPFYALLHALGYLLPTDVLQKLLLLVTLAGAGLGAHYLTGAYARRQLAGYVAGFLYACNPFVYDRFITGQFAVLMGYALLPWFTLLLWQFVRRPTALRAFGLGILAALIGILSLHTLGLVALLVVVSGGLALWRFANRKRLLVLSALSIGVFIVLSSFWLLPLVFGQGATAQDMQRFSAVDRLAFATEGGSFIGEIANIIRLQGFWAESQPLYLLPQDVLPGWGLIALAMIVLAAGGAWWAWRLKQRWMVAALAITATVAVLLATSLSGLLAGLPFFSGFREPQKFVGLLALAYAVFGGWGALWLQAKMPKLKMTAYAVLLLPLLYAPTLLWAANNQLKASQYPPDWYTVNQILVADNQSFSVLFLPWHQYMQLSFVERTVRNPADLFFAKPTIVSDDPEFAGLPPSGKPEARAIALQVLPGAAHASDVAERLARQNVKYVILAKESDYQEYAYLDTQTNLTLVHNGETLRLYKNNAWKEQ